MPDTRKPRWRPLPWELNDDELMQAVEDWCEKHLAAPSWYGRIPYSQSVMYKLLNLLEQSQEDDHA